jgi:hypothetical protein
MQSNAVRVAIAIGGIAVVVVLFIVLSGGDDEPTSPQTPASQEETAPQAGTGAQGEAGAEQTVTVPVIRIRDGKPVGGVQELEFTKGDRIRFAVRSDVADEVHVHGYDRAKDVEAGGTVSFNFEANLEGVFEVELEDRKEQIAELRVNPS